MLNYLQNELTKIKNLGLLRELQVLNGLDFCSNDYLGLSRSDFIKKDLLSFIERDDFQWSSSSRLIHGSTNLHAQAESTLASFVKREESLLFSSGYTANLGVIESLCTDSVIYSDELNHASLIDGIHHTRSEKFIFKHRDLNHLESQLKYTPVNKRKFIITESVFSMEGTVADLTEISFLCNKYQATLIVDESHATGIFGQQGEGLAAGSLRHLEPHQLITIHTCGKALGANGAFVACSPLVKKYLINKCRHFIYTTAPSPLFVFQILCSIHFILNHPQLLKKLWRNIEYFNSKLPKENQSQSPIFSLKFKGNHNVQTVETFLRNKGLSTKAIRYPTVPKGQERIRISIHSQHDFNEIDQLCHQLEYFKQTKERVS